MRWAFWRGRSGAPPEPKRPLPDDVGLPTSRHTPAARRDRDDDTGSAPAQAVRRTSGASPTADPQPRYDAPLAAAVAVDRTALASAGAELASLVSALLDGTPTEAPTTVAASDRAASSRAASADARTLAVAATGALAARLPVLSGVAGAAVFGEPEDELLHAYADVLVARTGGRRSGSGVDRDDLLAVAHLAAAAAAVGGAAEPALLLLAGAPAETQLQAAGLLLAQTADDGAGPPAGLPGEVRQLFHASG